MLITRNANNVNREDPVQFWLLVTASCLALTALLLTFPMGTVQADALRPRTATTSVQNASPVTSPTPVLTEDVQAERKMPKNLLRGVASWYGSVFHGRKTASGEKYNMYAMTACHPTLPFGTKVRVTNTRNHKSVVVRITDRGLLYDGRVLDLSYAAAEKLDMVSVGLAPVKIQILRMGHPQAN
ncbi:MAG TPA: septal ring lytic transglycosylase RlpA family protein [Terracidiphilus sp.]|nr:septal ring lytic transglycosylase RlpA family protein [Terracidiphilus sp.]